MNKRILVTGGTGLVGKHLKDIMPNAIYLSSRDANLLNAKSVDTIICMNKPDIVIHLAARVGGVLDNITYPVEYLEENTLINTNLLRACHKHDVQKVISIGSTCIYPDIMDSYPLKEHCLHKVLNHQRQIQLYMYLLHHLHQNIIF